MLAKTCSAGLAGIEAQPVEVEVDVTEGLPAVHITGLADIAIKESKERVKTAVKNSGFYWPSDRLTINLAPCSVKKEGSGFDLAIALGILSASGQINSTHLPRFCFLGELSLDGVVRPVKGVLPVAAFLKKYRIREIVVPRENAAEAAMVPGIKVYPVRTLTQAVQYINDPAMASVFSIDIEALFRGNSACQVDFAEVSGQASAKRAIEIAAAGRHNLLMIGPPGSGKTMLAHRIASILPPLTLPEALEVTKIHSAAGLLKTEGIIARHPFRSPHHTVSYSSLVGGGRIPQPGEISLAHNGILFLDELPEFHRDAIAALRQPLEEGMAHISRVNRSYSFPSSFMLVCAMNPCPCGFYSDPRRPCRCSTTQVNNYMGKVSGPLLDRIDIHIEVPYVKYKELAEPEEAEPSESIRERVEKARALQRQRFSAENIRYNAQMNAASIKRYCRPGKEGQELLKAAMAELKLSARGYGKILKLSRTIADLAGSELILADHVAEAVQYRRTDGID